MYWEIIKIFFSLLICWWGFFGALFLIYKDIKNKNFCPKVFKVPACYLVFIAYILVLISIYINSFWWFLGGALPGVLLALWFSYKEYFLHEKCPRFFRLPMCYLSLVGFILLWILTIV